MISETAQKMDILLNFRSEGYNLLDTEDPAALGMALGKGYSLNASVETPWTVTFNDGKVKKEYPLNTSEITHTYVKDARKLAKLFEKQCKKAGIVFKTCGEVVEKDEPIPQEEIEQIDSEPVEQPKRCNYDINKVIAKIDAIFMKGA